TCTVVSRGARSHPITGTTRTSSPKKNRRPWRVARSAKIWQVRGMRWLFLRERHHTQVSSRGLLEEQSRRPGSLRHAPRYRPEANEFYRNPTRCRTRHSVLPYRFLRRDHRLLDATRRIDRGPTLRYFLLASPRCRLQPCTRYQSSEASVWCF